MSFLEKKKGTKMSENTSEVMRRIEENAVNERFLRELNSMPVAYFNHLDDYLSWNPAASRVNHEFYSDVQHSLVTARKLGIELEFGEDIVLGVALLRNYAGTMHPMVQHHYGGAIVDDETADYRKVRHVVAFLRDQFFVHRKMRWLPFHRRVPLRSEKEYNNLLREVNNRWPD